MSFNYIEPNAQALQEEKARQDKEANSGLKDAFFLGTPGIYQIRVLPPHPNSGGLWYRRLVEYRIPIEKRSFFITSPSAFDQPDPVKEAVDALVATNDPENMKRAKDLAPRTQYLFNVLVLSAPNGVEFEFGKVYVLKAGEMVKRGLLELDQDEGLGWTNITDLSAGVNVTIKRTGKGQYDTRYDVNPHGAGRSNIVELLAQRGIDINTLTLNDLNELCPLKSEDEIRDLLRRGGFAVGQPQAFRPTGGVPVAGSGPAPVSAPVPAGTPTPTAAPQPVPVSTTPQAPPAPAQPVAAPAAQPAAPVATPTPPVTPPPPPPVAAPKPQDA